MMKRLPQLLALCLLALPALHGQPNWNNLGMYRLNKVQPHDRIVPEGKWSMSLNGTWSFAYFDAPSAIRTPVGQLPLRDTIHVPGNMELQGYGVPVYVNMRNEFPPNPPYAPTAYNPVGVYGRTFTLPEHWKGRRVIVKFGAAKSALYLYVNGTEVGYSQDSKTPAEWDITKYLHEGKNDLRAKVLRWCDGSYLECQDMWRMSGLTRDVELYSVPWTYITDIKIVSDLDTNDWRTGRLDVMVDLNREVGGGSIEWRLERGDWSVRGRQQLERNDWFTSFARNVGTVEPWSDSTPALYTLTLRLLAANGNEIERIVKKVGFRHVDIRGGLLRLNGRPMEIRGVNRHEHSMVGGHYITPAEMRQDIALMKEMGINAVRTCHYPNDELWYDLCDSAGIYVWDEANVESHAQGYDEGSLAKKREWLNPILDRIYNMYKRDRNHPSVIIWSLGNECGNGVCFEEAYRFLKGKDISRPVVYERAETAWNTDLVCTMYPSVQQLSEYARNPRNKRPYIISEYCHAMGNSMGGLQDYWDTIDRYPQLQGGFIWDWVDQSFWRGCWAAGGDLGALPGIKDDDAFCANGILAADRTPHPHAAEVEAVYTRRRPLVLPHTYAADDTLRHRPFSISQRRGEVVLSNDLFEARISTADGSITSYRYRGKEMLATPLRWNFWRPPTENDREDANGARAWQGLESLTAEMLSVSVGKHEVQMLMRLATPDGAAMRLKQIVEADGTGALQLSYLLVPGGQFRTLPKMGIQLGLDTAYTGCRFMGNQYETYPDRRSACRWAMWYKEMSDLSMPQYVVPQEQGNREASWVRFMCEGRPDLTVISPTGIVGAPHQKVNLNFSVHRYADSTLTRARRWCGLHPAPNYIVSIDHRQAGLGTATCGPGVAERYRLSGDSSYSYRFVLAPGNDSPDRLQATADAHFRPHGEMESGEWRAESGEQVVKIKNIDCSHKPASEYAEGYPSVLADGRRAVPGDYRRGWAGFAAPDTVVFTLTLEGFHTLSQVTVGACHSPSDWVVKPNDVQVQWSIEGTKWSSWQSLDLLNPPADLYADSRRLRYSLNASRAKSVHMVRLRFICRPTLPIWHSHHGDPSWLMVDEFEIRRSK